MSEVRPRLSIVGAGRVGGALARALHRRGYQVAAVWSRTTEHAETLAAEVGAIAAGSPAEAARAADLTLVAVPDDAIAPLTAAIADAGGWSKGSAAVHLSGTHGAAILEAAAARGTLTGAFHPLQTFADGRAPVLTGTAFGIEAVEPLRTTLRGMALDLDGQPLDVGAGCRPLYHAAAVMTANYAVTLMAQAVSLLRACGIAEEQALQALLPLLRGAVDGIERLGLPEALTGPIARGDSGTVRRHLAVLEEQAPDVAPLYQLLGSATLALAAERGLADSRLAELEELLGVPGFKLQAMA